MRIIDHANFSLDENSLRRFSSVKPETRVAKVIKAMELIETQLSDPNNLAENARLNLEVISLYLQQEFSLDQETSQQLRDLRETSLRELPVVARWISHNFLVPFGGFLDVLVKGNRIEVMTGTIDLESVQEGEYLGRTYFVCKGKLNRGG